MTTDVNFSVSKLLDPANRTIAENFNVDSLNYQSGLFSFENTYNHVNLGIMFACEADEEEPGGIWDASCRIDLERNLFVVVGNEGCSGFGATIEAFFDAKGALVDYKITGDVMSENLEEKVKTLVIEVFMVEPFSDESENKIREAYANVVE